MEESEIYEVSLSDGEDEKSKVVTQAKAPAPKKKLGKRELQQVRLANLEKARAAKKEKAGKGKSGGGAGKTEVVEEIQTRKELAKPEVKAEPKQEKKDDEASRRAIDNSVGMLTLQRELRAMKAELEAERNRRAIDNSRVEKAKKKSPVEVEKKKKKPVVESESESSESEPDERPPRKSIKDAKPKVENALRHLDRAGRELRDYFA